MNVEDDAIDVMHDDDIRTNVSSFSSSDDDAFSIGINVLVLKIRFRSKG